MASVNEIMQLCRLCLVKEEVNVPIFEEQGDLRQIFLKISACLPVKVSREDNLPKSICDGCSCKLEMFYQFWNTSTNSEKKLIKWLNQGGIDKPADKTSQHSMNIDPMILKQEVIEVADNQSSPDDLVPDDLNVSNDAQDYILQQQQLPYQNVEFQFQQDGFEETTTDEVATTVETEAPPTRKRRAAAMRALANMESEDEDDVDLIDTKIAKTEEQSDDSVGEDPEPTTFVGLPSATDNEQPGPSGVGKTPGDAPYWDPLNLLDPSDTKYRLLSEDSPSACDVCQQHYPTIRDLKAHVYSSILNMFICCRCGSKFVDEKTFCIHTREHMKQVFSNGGLSLNSSNGKLIDSRIHDMFVCKYCDAEFKDRVAFYNHYISHTKADSNTSKPVVNLKKLNVVAVKQVADHMFHLDKLYEKIDRRCQICFMGFHEWESRTSHVCLKEQPHCYMCNKTFRSNLKLLNHYDILHMDSKMCKFCFVTFCDYQELIEHVLKIHLRYSHFCFDCNLGFFTLQKFVTHINSHEK